MLILSIFLILIVITLLVYIFCQLTMGWCKSNTCLVGKTVLITGGNSGLGFETALALAGRGAKIIIADVADTKHSIEKIIKETDNENVTGKFLDLSSLDSVRKFCAEINKEEYRLDILINNAGMAALPLSYSQDGLQLLMHTNYFGHFLLTHLLIDLMKKTKSRIIFVSSLAAFSSDLTFENLNNPTKYSIDFKTHYKIYSNSKLCELIASNIFAEKLKGTSITSNALYPGIVRTPILTNAVNPDYRKWFKNFLYAVANITGKTPFEGAQTQINCALSKDLDNVTGKYFVECKPFFQPYQTKNKEFCMKIWNMSEEFVKLRKEEKLENILKSI